MDRFFSMKIVPYFLVATITLSGCSKKSECDIPTSHVHKYVKQVTDDITIEKYSDDERLNVYGYHWNENYIEINKVDEEVYKILGNKQLFDGKTNWEYLYNLMATHHDYLAFYYEYTTIETYTTTDSDGNIEFHTRTVHHDGWTKNPNYEHNTGKTRLYHHRYYGYRVVCIDGKFKLEKSPLVDDIREIIYDYPYFPEDCITEVYEEFQFVENRLRNLSPDDFDIFTGPDLENKSLEIGKVKKFEKK